ncbi:ATP-binding protein [Paludibacter sp. 221]|uniref:ATP-binding protein n=1 Tax=Paludibacter sp. 221 TaxID=2302939 RepID=UPI0013D623E2|nr:ATP-binding protein [Paludibacter sp. 221]NDV45466.1 ATP-binding protein [Paludibacter sp. 221]
MVSTTLLSNNESIGLGVIEIVSIPSISILSNKYSDIQSMSIEYKKEMGNLLVEVYQYYKMLNITNGLPNDISLEVLWTTHSVSNQPYKANIKIFLLVRSIGNDNYSVEKNINSILEICKTTLDIQKYEYKTISYEEFVPIINNIEDQSICAIVKEERIENLQNQILPVCYSFDQIPNSETDLSKIVNTLINYPNCAISFQLIPTSYTLNETQEIDRMTQMLDTLHKGIAEQGVGNISFSLAEKQAQIYKYYTQNKGNALFYFNILIYGDVDAVSNISTRVYGQLNASTINNAGLKFINLLPNEVNKDDNFYPLPWAINELLLGAEREHHIWDGGQISANYYKLPYIITFEEASEFFRLPFGNDKISAGLVVNESSKRGKTYTDDIINSGDIEVGMLKSSSKGDKIGFSLKDLAKHMLIVGTPGSGKTTFSVSLLDRLWKQHNIPFLVIEPAKNEYRALIQSIPDLQVFTPGKNFISPFIFNPFIPPKNVKLETYKSTLKTAFAAAVSMSTPLDKIFEEAINNCYSDFRWLDSYTSDDKGEIFNITDFIKCFQQTFDEIGYTGDAKNIGRAGIVRLNSLINLFDNYFSIPIEDLLQKPTIIELAAIENSDQKALIISLLLLSILAYVNANYIGEGGLKNVILLEEAHVLLDADTNAGQGEANPSAIAQGLVKRMLAEIRSYGVGLIVADQSPRKVSVDVVALTDMKLAFRLVEATDKQILADSTNMSDTQAQRLAKLKPGEAFFFFNKLDEPEEIVTEDYRLQNNISISLSDEGIKSLSTYWNDKSDKLCPYPECQHVSYCSTKCDYSRRILAKEISRRIFVRNFKQNDSNFDPVKKVFGQISKMIIVELNDEPFNKELLLCVKAQLWRKIKYGTKIPVSDTQIQKSLEK